MVIIMELYPDAPAKIIPRTSEPAKTPPPSPLVTKKTIAEITGKIKSVKKLMSYPRAQNPELRSYLLRLHRYFTVALSWTYMSKTKETSEPFRETWNMCKQLEEVVIRAIVIGEEDVGAIWREIGERDKKTVKESDV